VCVCVYLCDMHAHAHETITIKAAYVCVYMNMYENVYMHTCACIFICVYVYSYDMYTYAHEGRTIKTTKVPNYTMQLYSDLYVARLALFAPRFVVFAHVYVRFIAHAHLQQGSRV
jgi:hypothetical protein